MDGRDAAAEWSVSERTGGAFAALDGDAWERLPLRQGVGPRHTRSHCLDLAPADGASESLITSHTRKGRSGKPSWSAGIDAPSLRW